MSNVNIETRKAKLEKYRKKKELSLKWHLHIIFSAAIIAFIQKDIPWLEESLPLEISE